jgi:chemotaxis protein CheZ
MPDTAVADGGMAQGGARGLLRDSGHRAAIEDRLAVLRARHRNAASPEAISDVVEAVLASMHEALGAPQAAILAEVEQLGRTIAQAKQELASLHMDEINGAFIPSATDELDAIVAATAAATNEILDCVETVEQVAAVVPAEQAEALRHVTTRIYVACGFQDITGQRVTKVVGTLKTIDARVQAIIARFGEADPPPASPATNPHSESRLLNGPQLPGNGVDQASIDAMFDGR